MEVQINGKDVTAECKDLIHAMARLEAVTGQRQAVVVRKGVIQLIKSLRARTTKADKLVPQKDVRKYNGDGPKWITKQGDKAKRRYTIVRRAGTEDSYGYTTLSTSEGRARSKAGGWSRQASQTRQSAAFRSCITVRHSPSARRRTSPSPTYTPRGKTRGTRERIPIFSLPTASIIRREK